MILNAEHPVGGAFHTLDRVVKQVYMRDLKPGSGKAVPIYGIAVILGRYLDPSVCQVLYRVVTATVTELQLVCLCPAGKPDELMPEAYSEHRISALKHIYQLHRTRNILRVAGSV